MIRLAVSPLSAGLSSNRHAHMFCVKTVVALISNNFATNYSLSLQLRASESVTALRC
jgi:hypothetical protein